MEWFVFPDAVKGNSPNGIHGNFSGLWAIKKDQLILYTGNTDDTKRTFSISLGRFDGKSAFIYEGVAGFGRDRIGFFSELFVAENKKKL
jgi:hypothetical protein